MEPKVELVECLTCKGQGAFFSDDGASCCSCSFCAGRGFVPKATCPNCGTDIDPKFPDTCVLCSEYANEFKQED